MIALITESIACLTEEDCKKYGVTVIPLTNVVGGSRMTDRVGGVDADRGSFTLPPSEYDYYRMFYEMLKSGNQVLCITLSYKLSNAYANALKSSKMFGANQVAVIDSKSCAGGILLMIMKARALEAEGLDFKGIVRELMNYRNSITLRFYLSDIRTIRRSKRISMFSPGAAPILNQKPVFKVENGGVHYFTAKNTVFGCMKELVESLRSPRIVVINYSSMSWLQDLVDMVQKKLPDAEIVLRKATVSMTINLGDEIVCVVGD